MQPQQNIPNINPVSPPPQPKPSNTRIIIIAAIVGVAVLGIAAFLLFKPSIPQNSDSNSDPKAETLFYETLKNAAAQKIFRVGMYRGYYASEEHANANNLQTEWSTVSELDTAKRDYRNLYIYKLPGSDKYTVGRCLTGQDLQPFLTPNADMPTTMEGAVALLGKLQAAEEHPPTTTCSLLGVQPVGAIELAAARLNDGVFPVGFTEAEATTWTDAVKSQNLFAIKDEGTVTKDGKTLRKISFAPKKDATNVNKKLYDAFANIASEGKGEVPIQAKFSFISISYSNEGGIKGYYLIDESTKLPVYSELSNTDVTPSDGQSLRAFNVVRTKQNYSYGGPLTLNASSQPDFVK